MHASQVEHGPVSEDQCDAPGSGLSVVSVGVLTGPVTESEMVSDPSEPGPIVKDDTSTNTLTSDKVPVLPPIVGGPSVDLKGVDSTAAPSSSPDDDEVHWIDKHDTTTTKADATSTEVPSLSLYQAVVAVVPVAPMPNLDVEKDDGPVMDDAEQALHSAVLGAIFVRLPTHSAPLLLLCPAHCSPTIVFRVRRSLP
jgi:hypothetical protein